jgi:hypothetical protein
LNLPEFVSRAFFFAAGGRQRLNPLGIVLGLAAV